MHISTTFKRFFHYLGIFLIGTCISACSTSGSAKRVITPRQFSFQPDSTLAIKRAKDYMIRGSVLQMQGLYAEAILEFQIALRYDSSATILYSIAKNYAQLNKYDLAIEFARTSLLKDSTFVPNLILLADVLENNDDMDEVADIYEKIVLLEPNNKEHKFALGQLCQSRNPDRSIELFKEILRDEDDETTLWFLAQVYKKNRRYTDYLETLERLFSVGSDIRVANLLLQGYVQNKTLDKALQLALKLEFTALSDDFDDIHSNLTDELLEQTDSTLNHLYSLKLYLDLMNRQHSFNWKFYFNNGMLAARTNDTTLSESFFSRALSARDSSMELPIRLCGFYLQQSKFINAITLLQKFESEYPHEVRFPLFLGIAYSSVNKFQESLPHLRIALAIDSFNFDAWTQLGIVYDHLQRSDSSDLAYENALSINAASALVNNNYAYSLSNRQTKLTHALSMAQKAIQAQPLNPSFLDTYAWVNYQLGNYDKAKEYLEKAIEYSEPSATILEHLGDTYSKLGIDSKAYEAYKNAFLKSPERASLQERMQKLNK